MFDGWEAAHGCFDRKWADLPGYRRSFNKKSVESRGTLKAPGLTLNLAQAKFATCRADKLSLAALADDPLATQLTTLSKHIAPLVQ